MGLGLRYSNCHVGEEGQVLAEAAQEEGSAAIRETYIALKEQYYGSHSYDFSEPGLGSLIRNWGRDENPAETAALLDLMLEEYPQSFQAHFMYGQMQRQAGEIESAVMHLHKALELNPEAIFVQRRLEQLQQSLAADPTE